MAERAMGGGRRIARRIARISGAAAWAALGALTPASAMSMRADGERATLGGVIVPGDGEAFARFLASPEGRRVRVVTLDSTGGKVDEGLAIGRAVRRAGLATAVDAASAHCDSACTLIFMGGVRRHLVHGEAIYEGFSGRTGLGFHPAHRPGDRVEGKTYNPRGTDKMRRFYAEMGAPGAGALADQAAFDTHWRPSGASALRLGIATSLAAP